jgi:cytoskeletal protein RodZ
MTEFERKKIIQKSVGDKLRNLREAKDLSIDNIVSKTKIRRKYITALEASDWASLPSSVYTRGFVASYANVVGGDRRALVRAYERELGVSAQAQAKKASYKNTPYIVSSANMRKHHVTVTSHWFWWIGAIAVISGLVFYLYSTFATFIAEPLLIITQPQNNTTVESPDLTISGRTTASASITINNQSVIVNADGQFQGQIVLSSGVNTITVIATNRFDKITQSVVMVEFNDYTLLPTPEFELDTNVDVELELDENLELDSDLSQEENLQTNREVAENLSQEQELDTISNQEKDVLNNNTSIDDASVGDNVLKSDN